MGELTGERCGHAEAEGKVRWGRYDHEVGVEGGGRGED